jgi:hypothetical protein
MGDSQAREVFKTHVKPILQKNMIVRKRAAAQTGGATPGVPNLDSRSALGTLWAITGAVKTGALSRA